MGNSEFGMRNEQRAVRGGLARSFTAGGGVASLEEPRPLGRATAIPPSGLARSFTAGGGRGPRGFTLVEVLVVIAVITTLVAILLPAMSAGRKTARRTECQTNLRQIATAWHLYLDAHGGFFYQKVNAHLIYGGIQGRGSPQFGSDSTAPVPKPLNAQFGLPDVLAAGGDVFHCPADSGTATAQPRAFDFYGTSYRTNLFLIGQDQYPVNPADPCRDVLRAVNKRLRKLTQAKVTTDNAKLPLAGDFEWFTAFNRYEAAGGSWHGQPKQHNLAFFDGHVDFVAIRKGMFVTDRYAMPPFADLLTLTTDCQTEIP